MQIQAAVFALRNTRGLPWPKEHKKKKDEDILDWLQAMFGFQVMYFSRTELQLSLTLYLSMIALFGSALSFACLHCDSNGLFY